MHAAWIALAGHCESDGDEEENADDDDDDEDDDSDDDGAHERLGRNDDEVWRWEDAGRAWCR